MAEAPQQMPVVLQIVNAKGQSTPTFKRMWDALVVAVLGVRTGNNWEDINNSWENLT